MLIRLRYVCDKSKENTQQCALEMQTVYCQHTQNCSNYLRNIENKAGKWLLANANVRNQTRCRGLVSDT